MKKLLGILTAGIALTLATPALGNVVGYVNSFMKTGDNLFAVSLKQQDLSITNVFGTVAPEGTIVSLWSSGANSWNPVSVYQGGTWSVDLTLDLGVGAKVTTPSPFTLTVVGEVVNHDGGDYNMNDPQRNPPPFAGPPGIYLLSDKFPMTNTGDDVYWHILGRAPVVGDFFSRLDVTTQTYIYSTFGPSGWDVTPTLAVGEAGFFIVPEPSTSMIIMAGGLLLCALRRRS